VSSQSPPDASSAVASAAAFMGVTETADLLGLSKMTVYRRCRSGEWPSGRSGRKLLLPTPFVLGLVAEITNGRNVVAEEYAATMWPAKAESATSGAVA
jgi:excisionase family DNA binding protein